MSVLAWLATFVAVLLAMTWADRLRARVWPALRLTWPSALLLLGGFAALVGTDQGREVALGLRGEPRHAALMVAATWWWAAQSWFWSRFALNRRYGTDRKAWGEAALAVAWLPRIYGFGSFATAGAALVFALMKAGPSPDLLWTGLALAAAFAAFLGFLQARTWLAARTDELLGRILPERWAARLRRCVAPKDRRATTHGQPDAPLARLRDEAGLTLAFIIISIAALFWGFRQAYWHPVETGERYGAAAVALFGLGTWVAVLSLLTGNHPFLKRTLGLWLERRLGPRLGRWSASALDVSFVPTLIVLAVVLAWMRPINPVRTLGPAACAGLGVAKGAACDPAKREDVAAAALRWAGMQPEPDPKPHAPLPMVFVATAGGGLRAAYWTAAVLGRLADERPAFKDRLFAVSGVSGGSVGALGFAALVRLQRDGRKPKGSYQALLGRAHSRDLLAPTLAALLFEDPARGLLWGVRPHGGRGTALESGFESAWSRAMRVREGSPMDGPFLALWSRPERGWVPALFLNSTHLETGRRVVAASLKVQVKPFTDAWDLHDLLGADVYATVAAHNSARFSWVSPAGELLLADGGPSRGNVIDGGYFENFGAETLREVVADALATLSARGHKVRPIVIQISSDPALAVRDRAGTPALRWERGPTTYDLADCEAQNFLPFDDKHDLVSVAGWWNELLAPVGGVLSSRVARGILASKGLARYLGCGFAADPNVLDPVFVHLAMPEAKDGSAAPPLGWVMTPETRATIDAYLDDKDNRAALDLVLAVLGGKGAGEGAAAASTSAQPGAAAGTRR